ncbi:succinate dehydrogenase / fumarate reductase cytochrome b subunit [Kutzneria viridogrisea]|uniref:Succinate dehydrogenase / fumarate reductase cytochrome b subunit n=1 Tax=Kutzneria viridogrisea TaxID=47990 RepID=A0ABR6BNR6_9PSEU|nr:succinate dehydrogenase / fumarate reductase cytochrome b subunit [Kutzneria viridogrisea]
MVVLSTSKPLRLWRSTVGKKAVMAITGALLFLYVVAHALANLKIFFGPDALDGYGHWLRTLAQPAFGYGGLLWVARAVLLAALVLHVTAAAQLARRARKARPVGYAHRATVQGSYPARTMRWGGVLLLLFVVYHVLDITTGTLNPHGVPGEDYRNVVADFQRWPVVVAYTAAILALGLHLWHGVWSALQSLGSTLAARRAARIAALAASVSICAAFLSVPFAVLTGVLR